MMDLKFNVRRVNKVNQALANNQMALGTWVQMNSPEIVEIIGNQGYDFVIIDMEHGNFGIESVVHMIRAAEASGVTPIVRVPHIEPSLIGQVLEAGAMGVAVPGISTKYEAEQSVEAAKSAPLGNRGACPWVRASGHCISMSESPRYLQWVNEETSVWLLVEGAEGVANFDEIISVPNVSVILLGIFDLSLSLGIPGQFDHPKFIKAHKEMIAKAREKNITLGGIAFYDIDPEIMKKAAAEWKSAGGQILTIGGDRPIMAIGLAHGLKSFKEGLL
jgi:4-hydroxy-2-oxoheptanedioate aldolase